MASAVTETLQPSGETGKNQNKQNECDQLKRKQVIQKAMFSLGKIN